MCSSIYTESLQFVYVLLYVSVSFDMDTLVILSIPIYFEASESKRFPHVRKFRIWMAFHFMYNGAGIA
jgi:hypothetical protein